MCGLHHRAMDHHVVVDELSRPGAIGHDAAYGSSHQVHVVGAIRFEPVRHLALVAKVELSTRRRQDVGESRLTQPANNGGTHQASVSSHVDPSSAINFILHHQHLHP